MKKSLISVSALIILISSTFLSLGCSSQTRVALGMAEGKLQPCPNKPNCVYSESESETDAENFIAALNISNHPSRDAMSTVADIISELGGEITTQKDHYIAATFTSLIFRFVDDFEVRLDTEQRLIHFRSASRVGTSDFGVNRKRVNAVKQSFLQRQPQ